MLDDGAVADSATRVRELAAAVQTDAPRPGRTAPGRKPRVPARPRWAMASVSAAIAIGVTLAVIQVGDGGSSTDTVGTPGTGEEYLLVAAARLEAGDGETRGGGYWYQEEQSGSLRRVPGKNDGAEYVVVQRETRSTWQAEAWEQRWTQVVDNGTRPASVPDERAWRNAGSPKEWHLPAGFPPLRYHGAGVTHQDAPGTGDSDGVRMANMDLDRLKELPTDPGALRAALRNITKERFNAPDTVLDRHVRQHLLDIAVHLPAEPKLRAAAYRTLSQETGVRDLGVIEDPSGRKGKGVALPQPGGDTEVRLVLNRKTGAPLGSFTVTTRAQDGWKKGTAISYSTIVSQRWTNTAPPFNKDRIEVVEAGVLPQKTPQPTD